VEVAEDDKYFMIVMELMEKGDVSPDVTLMQGLALFLHHE
jgi:hypothetical protein